MDYQLVLQFHEESLQTFKRLENLKERVIGALGEAESFDGLDVGNHGANLFLYTANPSETFQRLRPLLDHAESAAGFIAAYRTVSRERFEVIWPPDSTAAFSLR